MCRHPETGFQISTTLLRLLFPKRELGKHHVQPRLAGRAAPHADTFGNGRSTRQEKRWGNIRRWARQSLGSKCLTCQLPVPAMESDRSDRFLAFTSTGA